MNIKQFYLKHKHLLTLGLIILSSFLLFSPALSNGFVNLDDPEYILNNRLLEDLSLSGVRDIFSTYLLGNYQPLTILSLAIEHHFIETDPFYYHLSNMLWHMANIVLVYLFISLLSRKRSIALIVALLFAVHPMRVESVVWITERKDVLFTFFYLLGLIQYLYYLASARKTGKHLVCTFIFFLLALFAKPTAMSFPLILLLLDYIKSPLSIYQAIKGKLVFFVFSFVFGVVAIFGTYSPTDEGYSVAKTIVGTLNQTITPLNELKADEEVFRFSDNIIITCHAITQYIIKVAWPQPLSPYYPLPDKINGHVPLNYYIAIVLVLLMVFYLWRSRNKHVQFCLLFFGATIFFNLPLGRVGSVEMADRFTYVSYIGLFYLLATLFMAGFDTLKVRRSMFLMPFVIVLFLGVVNYAVLTFTYTQKWKSGESLWTTVIEQNPHLAKGYFNRGNYYLQNKDFHRALNDYRAVLAIEPQHVRALNNMGNCHLFRNRPDLALARYAQALQIDPDYKQAWINKNKVLEFLNKK